MRARSFTESINFAFDGIKQAALASVASGVEGSRAMQEQACGAAGANHEGVGPERQAGPAAADA